MADDYELFPQKLIEDLKYDVEALKKKLSEPENVTQELIAEIEDFKTQIKELNNVFQQALQDVKEEDTFKLLTTLHHKVETITTQNETIARGMVAISDKLEEFMKGQSSPKASPRLFPPQNTLPPASPPSPNLSRFPPPPNPSSSNLDSDLDPPLFDLPPPPPSERKPKRFGIFK